MAGERRDSVGSSALSKCECRVYYHQSDEHTCVLVDLCTLINASACQPNAECYMVTPGQTGCRCKQGYVGTDICTGNIMQHLRRLNTDTEGSLYQQLTTGIVLLEAADLGVMLSSVNSYFTLFIPNEGAFDKMDQQVLDEARNDREFARYLMKMFIVPIQLDSQNLINAGYVFNLLGFQAEVVLDQEHNELKYSLVSEMKVATLISTNLVASNGIIHVLNQVLFTKPPIASNTSITLYEKISEEDNYHQFKKFLDLFNFNFLQESDGPYTVFVPVNQAFENLTEEELQFLLSEQGTGKLQNIIENHIITDTQVSIDAFLTQRRLVSLYGSDLNLFVSSKGELDVSSQSTITLTDVLAKNGIIHEVSNLIIPNDVEPLVPAWCNTTSYQLIQGICGSCVELEMLMCPVGSVKVNNDTMRGCLFTYRYSNIELQQVGCSLLCNQTIIVPLAAIS
ncbi:stabilin-2-like [Anneissia japonica]|uniref:stabilin-2-like n=1 Tax=Anneissia japonica TaxID=1529436 RepID=UPI0014258DBB|nr:stabilin-2-like [Anneissia japonica]